MSRLILFGLILFFTSNIQAEELKASSDNNLTYILNNLIEFPGGKEINNDFKVRIFVVPSNDHCTAADNCRPLKKLFIVTSELGFKDHVMRLYELPPKHGWHFMWGSLDKGKQELYLRADTYSSDKPDASKKEENMLLKLDHVSAELNTL